MSLNVEEPYKEEEVLNLLQVRLNSRGRERVLKVKVTVLHLSTYILGLENVV